jgi:hypothetical protein
MKNQRNVEFRAMMRIAGIGMGAIYPKPVNDSSVQGLILPPLVTALSSNHELHNPLELRLNKWDYTLQASEYTYSGISYIILH